MSYVDLMSSQRWTEADHIRRTEAMVREHWSAQDETIINRKAVGAALGQYTFNAQDLADIADLKTVTEMAQDAGIAARVDSALLIAALDVEVLKAALDAVPPAPQVDPENPDAELPPDEYADARSAAQAAYDAAYADAGSDVQQLLADRQAWRDAQSPQPPESPEQ